MGKDEKSFFIIYKILVMNLVENIYIELIDELFIVMVFIWIFYIKE